MSATNSGSNEGRSHPPAAGRLERPAAKTPAGIPSAATVPSVTSARKPPPLPLTAPAKRSVLPILLVMGLITVLAIGGAAYFALDNIRLKDQLAEANRNATSARESYEQTAGKQLKERDEELAQARADFTSKERDLTSRANNAERDLVAAKSEATRDVEQARSAKSQAEAKLATAQGQLNAANQEISRLRSQVANSNERLDEILKSSSTDIRNWFVQQFAPLSRMDSQQEIRVTIRKHEMSKLLDVERKKQDKLVFEAAGTLELGNSESGLAFRSAILRYATISAPVPASVSDVKLVYRWTVNESATSLDPGADNDIVSYSGITGGSPDGSKDLRFDFRKTDDRFHALDTVSPVSYKGERTRMVFCMQFKEKGDPALRWLIFRANAIERLK